jgi:hypothetical protein
MSIANPNNKHCYGVIDDKTNRTKKKEQRKKISTKEKKKINSFLL